MEVESMNGSQKNAAVHSISAKRIKSFPLTEKQIRTFLATHAKSGCTEETIRQYQAAIKSFYEFLPENKCVLRGSLENWQEALSEQGYSTRTILARVSAVNMLMDFLGRRDFQYHVKLDRPEAELPVLTRDEYIQLLQEAKRQEDITLYLLVKTFAVAGMSIQNLDDLTREAIDCGIVKTERKRYSQTLVLPAPLRQELLDYAMREGIRTGPVFRTKNKKTFNRSVVTTMISKLGEAAGLEPGKANPRSLKRLYQNTFADYQRQADAWMANRYARLLEEEEVQVGWMAGKG